ICMLSIKVKQTFKYIFHSNLLMARRRSVFRGWGARLRKVTEKVRGVRERAQVERRQVETIVESTPFGKAMDPAAVAKKVGIEDFEVTAIFNQLVTQGKLIKLKSDAREGLYQKTHKSRNI
ncbi:unnamed protein product, partial [marine sediment metagenome]